MGQGWMGESNLPKKDFCVESGNHRLGVILVLKYQEITDKIMAAAFKVHSVLGPGYLEKVYENAMVIELQVEGLEVHQQWPISVRYGGNVVGEFFADLLVENKIIVELKSTGELAKFHEYQLHNYLKATGMSVGLLIGFGDQKAIIKRKDL